MISNSSLSHIKHVFSSKVQYRIFALIALLMVLSIVAMGVMAWAATELTADSFINQRVKSLQAQWVQKSIESGEYLAPSVDYLKLYISGDKSIPAFLRPLNQTGLEEFESRQAHVFSFMSPLEDRLLHLVYYPNLDSNIPEYGNEIAIYLVCMMLLLIVVGLFAAHVLAKHLTAPILALEYQVRQAGDAPPLVRLDELGKLSCAVDETFQQVSRFVQREKNFTRFASHELRTPVHTIQGAAELLSQSESDKKKRQVISRILNSAHNMQSLIQTFLLLGREVPTNEKPMSWLVILEKSIEQHRCLLSKKRVRINTQIKETSYCLLPSFGHVVIANILRNAFSYSHQNLEIMLSGNRLLIVNDITTSHVSGFGHGTLITAQICQNANWIYHQKISQNTCYTLLYW